jgi:hypothetical protein
MKRRATTIRNVGQYSTVPDRRERGMDALAIGVGLLLLFMLLWTLGVL